MILPRPEHVSPRRQSPRRWLKGFLLVLLLALPVAAFAAAGTSWWCTMLPFLPACAAGPGGGNGGNANGTLTEVSNFGSNPGALRMFTYRPANLATNRPLVVALHGCTQQASSYDDETGWIKFADKHRFALLLPQQQQANNLSKCFNWFLPGDNERDKGEALSIRQMIDRVKADAGSDPRQIYITGLSGGGAMTAVMLATYPELFAGGAILAGVPYKCANDAAEALSQCGVSLSGQLVPTKDLAPAQWGSLVRSASSHTGALPRVSIWQGSADKTVNPLNQQELVDQWTNVLGIDATPDTSDTLQGHAHKVYKDSSGKALLETLLIDAMAHGTPVGPGNADNECGKAAPFILNVGVCSSFHIVRFWGLDQP